MGGGASQIENGTRTGGLKGKETGTEGLKGKGTVEVSVFLLYPEIAQWKDHLYMLKFNDGEITKLYGVYKKLRIEDSDEVSLEKLLDYTSLQDSIFMRKVFGILANPETGNIPNYFHFVLTIWHYCTIGKDMAALLFDLYDTEQQTVLDGLVADQMIKELYGKKFDKSQVALQLIIRMNRQSPQRIPRYFFLEFIYANPVLLQPCQVYRKKLITRIFLEKPSWDRLEQERIILMRGVYYPAPEILEMTEQYTKVLVNQQKILQRQQLLEQRAAANSSVDSFQQPLYSTSRSLSPSVTHSVSPSQSHSVSLSPSLPIVHTSVHTHHSTHRRPRTVGFTTTALTVGGKTVKPITQKGEYDESIQIHIKPLPPTRAPRRIKALRYYNYMT